MKKYIAALLAAVVMPIVHAQVPKDPYALEIDLGEGYLCCNMRANDNWISDANYIETGARIVSAGTPVKHDGFGRFRVHVLINGARQSIGNDYSRDLGMEAFAKRYIVKEDPRRNLASASPAIRKAVESFMVTNGMTREQVAMAIGYPISSENPNLDAKIWRYWLTSFEPFKVYFDEKGRVAKVEGDADVVERVYAK